MQAAMSFFRAWPLLIVGMGCADPGLGAISKGNRAARDGRYDEAIAAYAQACTEAPQLARAHALHGNALWAAGRTDDALVAWQKASALDATEPDATLGLARGALRAGDAGAAIDRLTSALAKAPGRADLHTARALAYVRRNADGDVTRATEDVEAAFRVTPKDLDVLYTRGSVMIAAKRFNDAQSALDALERAAPKSALASYGFARLAAAQSRKTDVMLHLRAARLASGAAWQPAPVTADPAFAFLKDDPDFVREVAGR